MNAAYDKLRYGLGIAGIDFTTDSVKAVLVDSSYTFDATDPDFAAISAAVLTDCTPQVLAGGLVDSVGNVQFNSPTFTGRCGPDCSGNRGLCGLRWGNHRPSVVSGHGDRPAFHNHGGRHYGGLERHAGMGYLFKIG